jgi:hypothetical protein
MKTRISKLANVRLLGKGVLRVLDGRRSDSGLQARLYERLRQVLSVWHVGDVIGGPVAQPAVRQERAAHQVTDCLFEGFYFFLIGFGVFKAVCSQSVLSSGSQRVGKGRQIVPLARIHQGLPHSPSTVKCNFLLTLVLVQQVEMFVLTEDKFDSSARMLDEINQFQIDLFASLGLHFK